MDLKKINEIKKKYPTAIINVNGNNISYLKGTPDKRYLPKSLYEFEKQQQLENGGGVLTKGTCDICFSDVETTSLEWDNNNKCNACPDCHTPS